MENQVSTKPNEFRKSLVRYLFSFIIASSIALVIFQPLDKLGEEYIDSAFKRSLLSFAVARGLNGVISVAQGTEFAIQPAGVGVNFAPGEVLDPVNDLVERFSWIMLLSSSSLGAQKVLLSISAWVGITLALLLCSGLYLVSLWWGHRSLGSARVYISKALVMLFVLRFSVPAMALLNEWAYRLFLQEQYTSASEQLKNASDEIGEINRETDIARNTADADQGLMEKAMELYDTAVKQVDFERRLERYKDAAESISENSINLIVVFLLQTIVFPLIFLWLVVKTFKKLFS